MKGITVLEKEFDKQEEIRIPLPITLRGVYLLKITDSEDKNYIIKIIIKDWLSEFNSSSRKALFLK